MYIGLSRSVRRHCTSCYTEGSIYPNSIYFGLKVVPILGTLGPKYKLFGHMDP